MRRARGRRRFLAATGAVTAGVALGARSTLGAPEKPETVRCGFVGVGGRGTALLRAVVKVPGVEVAGVCDTDPEARERARAIIQEAGGAKPDEFEQWKELLDRDDIPALVSALPCDLHYPLYRDALVAGKHLYGEKPLCLAVKHADDLIARVREAGTVFQIGFQRRFNPVLQTAVKAFQEGIIGKPFEGRGVRYGTGGPYRRPGEWFSFRERSGDWMLEQAVHQWDAFNWALGELPESAYGTGHQDLFKDQDPERNVSDYYSAIIKYRNGLRLTWAHTWVAPPHSHFTGIREQLIGPRGGIDLSQALVAFRRGKAPEGRTSGSLVPGGETGNRTESAVADFFRCVRDGTPPRVGVKEGRNATLFGLLVRKAVYEERVVTMDEVLAEHAGA